ncbi:hypothetical protein WUBG_16820, partial [Wuchereria bancrofti]
ATTTTTATTTAATTITTNATATAAATTTAIAALTIFRNCVFYLLQRLLSPTCCPFSASDYNNLIFFGIYRRSSVVVFSLPISYYIDATRFLTLLECRGLIHFS